MKHKDKHVEEHDNVERWMVSYADFITLLFAFFTVMYAISHVDTGKLEKFAASTKDAFNVNPVHKKQIIEGVMPSGNNQITLSEEIKNSILSLGVSGDIQVRQDERGVILSLKDSLLFDSGRAEIKDDGLKVLDTIASIIRRVPYRILIEGHTDNVPIKSNLFPSNWELSTTRAANVLNYLIKNYNLPPERFAISGYAEYRPIASNETLEGRAKNRRVDIVFINDKNQEKLDDRADKR
jgi:chemotaxis protein MotB